MITNTIIERTVDTFVKRHLVADTTLTKFERKEMSNLALGLSCKDASAKENIGNETIRVRRKSIYRKLNVTGHTELIAGLLELLSVTCEVPGTTIDVVVQQLADPSSRSDVSPGTYTGGRE